MSEGKSAEKQKSEVERGFLDTLLFWATSKGRLKNGKLRGHGMQIGDIVSGPRADLATAEVKEAYEFLLSLDPGRWPLPNACSPLFQKFIDHILQNVKDLFKYKKELLKFDLLKKDFKALEDSLKYLKTFLRFIKDATMELEKSSILFNQMELITRNAAYIFYLSYVEEMNEELVSRLRLNISNALQYVKPIKPQVTQLYTGAVRGLVKSQIQYLRDVIEFVQSFVHFLLKDVSELIKDEDQIKSLSQATMQLVSLLVYPPAVDDQAKLSDILNCVEGLIAKVASGAYSFSVDKEEKQNPAAEVNLVFSDLLKEIDYVMKDLKDITCKAPVLSQSNFPRTNGLGFVGSLLFYLKELQEGKCDSAVKHLFKEAQEELSVIRLLLGKLVKQQHEFVEVKEHDLSTQVISLAYKAECIVDCLVMGDYPVWYQHLFSQTTTEMKLVKDQLMELHDKIVPKVDVPFEKESEPVTQEVQTPLLDVVMVGFEDEADWLIEKLIRGPKPLDAVSIVGMPGLGKTTLAKSVYDHEAIRNRFSLRAWCCVSQSYDKRRLLLDILNQVRGPTQQKEKDPPDALRKFLINKRYFVVIDDIWSVNTWDDLRGCFPDNENGSRILFTSRLTDVASDISSEGSLRQLRFLYPTESWSLLKHKLFNNQPFPSELSEVGESIARKCQGLPLLVILVAGILSGMSKNEESWRQIADNINLDKEVTSVKECFEVIELSYKHLPDHLKPCLLCFATFREDEVIPFPNLAWLWTAEGVVRNIEGKSAESLLNDLIGRSLIMVSKKRSTGGVRTCQIHDVLYDFCVKKAKEEKFMQITSSGKADLSSSFYEHRRMCIHHSLYWAGRIGNLQVRSAFFRPPKSSCQEFSDLDNFKLLRVLQMECVVTESSLQKLKQLVHLKLLGIKGYVESMPPWISNLSSLEVLLVITVGSGTILPAAVWNMPSLKHVRVKPGATFDARLPRKSTNLCCIETLATVSLTNKLADYMSKRATRLRKLKCHSKEPLKLRLDALQQLETLCINGKIMKFSLPSALTKLTLSDVLLPQSEMCKIGKLPNLVVLKLEHRAFLEGNWDIGDEEYVKLQVLKLRSIKIIRWNVPEDEVMPSLQQLIVENCFHLQEIPQCIGDIPTLMKIEVKRCGESLVRSAREIQEEQAGYGNEELKFDISPLETSVA